MLNIKLYFIKDIKFNIINQKEKKCIEYLIGKELNDMPILGVFCKHKTILEEIDMDSDIVSFIFDFEKESIVQEENTPVKTIVHIKGESRLYISKRLAAVISDDDNIRRTMLSVINTIPSYVNLRLNPGFNFGYTPPCFEEICFEPEKLEYLRYFLYGNLVYANYQGENSFRFLFGSKCDEEKCTYLNIVNLKGKCRALQLYFKDKSQKKNSITINCRGEIYSTLDIEEETLAELVKLTYLLYNVENVEEFIKPIHYVINEYCSFIHSEMPDDGRRRIKLTILSDLRQCIGMETGMVFLTISFNMLLKLSRIENPCEKSVDISEYSALVDFIKFYNKKKYNIKLSDDVIENIICNFIRYIKLSSGNEEKLINLNWK